MYEEKSAFKSKIAPKYEKNNIIYVTSIQCQRYIYINAEHTEYDNHTQGKKKTKHNNYRYTLTGFVEIFLCHFVLTVNFP